MFNPALQSCRLPSRKNADVIRWKGACGCLGLHRIRTSFKKCFSSFQSHCTGLPTENVRILLASAAVVLCVEDNMSQEITSLDFQKAR